MAHAIRRWACTLAFTTTLVFVAVELSLGAQEVAAPTDASDSADDEPNPYQPGVVVVYKGTDGVGHTRVEEEIAFSWGSASPDRRVPPGAFQATFSGQLLVQTPGTHTLRIFASGAVRLELAGKLLVDASSAEASWLDGQPIDLEFGYHPLVLRYSRGNEPARVALFWEGPRFQLEPLAARWLFHDSTTTPSRDFDDGRELVRALRCAGCHEIPGEPERLAAPSLDRLTGNISRPWVISWLTDVDGRQDRKMPHFGLPRSDAEAVADYLIAESEKTPPADAIPAAPPAVAPRKKKQKKGETPDADKPQPPEAEAGQRLFRSVGCLACHRAGPLGSDGLFGGGDLSTVAEKRPADFFARWLTDPAATNREHRMPVFALTSAELGHLSAYLQTLHVGPEAKIESRAAAADRGRALVGELRCAACHTLPKSSQTELPNKRRSIDLGALDRPERNCLFGPDAAEHRPGYRLDEHQRQTVATFLQAIKATGMVAARDGKSLLEDHNCLSCHARATERGLAMQLPAIAEADPSLRDLLPAMAPPSLVGVGDKLHDASLRAAIDRAAGPRYTWLSVRMPKFPLTENEGDVLARHLIDTDRIPVRSDAPSIGSSETRDPALEAAGGRLVTADGFGCTSCHTIGKWKPQKVAPGAEGTDLSQLGRHIRREWFDRWVRDPARIVPQMEMPAVRQPIRGVLEGDLAEQLAAIWHVLDRPGFTPPAPSALRVVRRANLPDLVERAAVLTDVIEVDGRPLVKPLVIGLPNRHNVLFDLARARLAAWWIGDTARQQTRGKSWYWEAGPGQLLPLDKQSYLSSPSDIQVTSASGGISGALAGQYVTEFDWFEHVGGGVRFGYRLHFSPEVKLAPLRIEQEFKPLPREPSGGRSGFVRRIQVGDIPKDASIHIEVLPAGGSIARGRRSATRHTRGGRIEVILRSDDVLFRTTRPTTSITPIKAIGTTFRCEMEYWTDARVDEFAPLPAVDRSTSRAGLDVVPGIEVVRLPVTDQAMPTGLAWRPDGTLVVSSLEGRVWLGHDTDGDGLEDQLAPFSDELAAPYGVATSGQQIDVINKYGLLRLVDADGDGHAERTELLASGWAHTRDYHDWAIGLPRDAEGNYYVSLPCQQDDRARPAARLRGTIIKLVGQQPSAADPRRFAIEPICAGLRFANGLALSPSGELFATDNQGNYTPFNELNHIVQGARYGFINRLESKPGFNPPYQSAAIEIPHPWTRSVNGICFLTTPAAVESRRGKLFGPFEGHLVGCEYDTRRLVRMSLERVGEGFQGAVYPLSREVAEDHETFEGPLVCQVAPNGDLYVGNVRDSGWGAGSNTGSLVRLRPAGQLPSGIAEVRAVRGGFAVNFTQPVDPRRAADAGNYSVSSYRRIPTPAYGGPDVDRRVEKVKAVRLETDARRATIELDNLREGFVYEFHLANLAPEGTFFPAEAYYTLRHKK